MTHLTAAVILPGDGVGEVLAQRVHVDGGEQQQVEAHEQVGEGEVAHEELGHGHLAAARDQHHDDHQVPAQRGQQHEPHRHAQPLVAVTTHTALIVW